MNIKENRLERTIKLLRRNGIYDCPDCDHRAKDIESLVHVVEKLQEVKDFLPIGDKFYSLRQALKVVETPSRPSDESDYG